jgi:hypothetical protein
MKAYVFQVKAHNLQEWVKTCMRACISKGLI